MPSSRRSAPNGVLLALLLAACETRRTAPLTQPLSTAGETQRGAVAAPTTSNLQALLSVPSAAVSGVPALATDEPIAAGCPDGMTLVQGEFCPNVEQRCKTPEGAELDDAATCFEYVAPSRCLSEKRELMRFCIDRYEWPNQAGTRPRVLTQWFEAKALCEQAGKRLCQETEWLFACEGESMLPYTYGYRRDPTACVLDRLYVQPGAPLLRWEACLASVKCRAELARLDQREPAGSFKACVSPFGVFDLNGNVNEWVEVPGAAYPNRSGLKGGWWGPVRDRCRPTVRFHKEDDWGYEVGFRCCRNALP